MTLNGGGERGGGWRSRVLCGDKNVCLQRAALRQATRLVSLFVPARLSQREAKRQPSPYLLNGRVAFSPSCPTDSTTQAVVRVKLTHFCCVDTLQSLRFVNLVLSPLKEKQTNNSFSSNNISFQSFGVF